jgi:hypothetical protein
MKKLSIAAIVAVIASLLIATVAFALFFINGSFENPPVPQTDPNWPGWSAAGQREFVLFTGGYDVTGFPNLSGTGADLSAIVGGPAVVALSLSDINTGNVVKFPAVGHYSARINSQDSWNGVGVGHGQNANTLYQATTVDAADIDGSDGKVHLRLMYSAVMVEPDPASPHTADERPMFFVEVKDLGTVATPLNVVLLHKQSYVGEPGVPWQTGPAVGTAGSGPAANGTWKYLDWTYVDVIAGDGSGPASILGHTLSIKIVATGCSPGGHPGYVYVDEVGSAHVGVPTVEASGPATRVTGQAITYTYNYFNGTGASIDPTINVTPPVGVTFTTVDPACTSDGLGGYNCGFTGVGAGGGGSFNISGTVTAAGGSTIDHGDYHIITTGFPTLTGPVVITNVLNNTAPVANPDSYSTNVGTLLNATTVLVNDTDAESNPLTAIQVTGPSHAASFTLNANGTFAYTSAAGFSGQDTFTYKANDGLADSNTVTVTITVIPTLTLTGSGAATIKPGDQYVYTLAYTVNATTLNTQVVFTLPGHTTFVSNTGGYTCTPLAGVVTCNLGTVSANGSFTATVLLDKFKKVNTPLTLNTTAYSINATSAVLTNGSTTVTANTITPFADVPAGHWALDYIQSIWAYGITGGCINPPLTYCPDVFATRGEMAVIIERSIHTSAFNPGVLPLTFTDTNTTFAKYWIEALKADGITNGCSLTQYCPNMLITRAQMAIFLLRGKYTSAHVPTPATGLVWLDVPKTYWAAAWAEELGTLHISSGCRVGGYFCPENYVTRTDMAVLVQRTFNLTMPTP